MSTKLGSSRKYGAKTTSYAHASFIDLHIFLCSIIYNSCTLSSLSRQDASHGPKKGVNVTATVKVQAQEEQYNTMQSQPHIRPSS